MPGTVFRSVTTAARTPVSLACTLLIALIGAHAQEAPKSVVAATQLDPVSITGNYLNSRWHVRRRRAPARSTSKLIESRPTLRPAEVLEFVPGVIVSQHSGDGKANQYYLRGVSLDHGTDFATFVDGMPINMPTHAHGQGYSDFNWLIPELVQRIRYRKGAYYAEEGDFASAGSARIDLLDALPRGIASLTLGEERHARTLFANSNRLAEGNLLYAVELAHNNGPWDNPEKFHRANGLLRYSFGSDIARSTITAMGYSAGCNSTDEIPQRALDSGLVGRYGALDPPDGGFTSRYSLSYGFERKLDDGAFKLNAYAIQSKLDLYSNFTFFLDNPIDLDSSAINGDQFEQAEHRRVFGMAASRSWNMTLGGHESTDDGGGATAP